MTPHTHRDGPVCYELNHSVMVKAVCYDILQHILISRHNYNQSINLSIHPCIHPSTYLSTYQPIYLPTYLPVTYLETPVTKRWRTFQPGFSWVVLWTEVQQPRRKWTLKPSQPFWSYTHHISPSSPLSIRAESILCCCPLNTVLPLTQPAGSLQHTSTHMHTLTHACFVHMMTNPFMCCHLKNDSGGFGLMRV